MIDREQGCLGADKAAAEHEARLAYADTHGDDEPPAWARPHWTSRIPPSNDDAERTLLGTLMANNLAFHRTGNFLRAEHFADPVHRCIYAAIKRRVDAGQMADYVVLKAEFEHSDRLDEVGGTAYLQQLLMAPEEIIDPAEYARSISDAWLRRQTIDLSEQASVAAAKARECAFGLPSNGYVPTGSETANWLIGRLQAAAATLQAYVDQCSEGAHDDVR